ncbi:hypothetical protein RN001_001244 [Aquatica leii]|uniref:N-acetyltransferase ESCO acetyl-transferase domain-containing protein n=1 Tax=Aquatica leii TaxID=1421715 RepID=A0AAN7QMM2_9COLE|nr:hypothetical protein RN001_001244 [Aquatica leii]
MMLKKLTDYVNEITMSPLFLSRAQIVPQAFAFLPKKLKLKSLDLCESQDSSALNTIANKLIRNYSVDDSPSDLVEIGKRKFPFSTTPTNKQIKLDQVFKTRTELFPQDTLSQPLSDNNTNILQYVDTKKIKSRNIYLCGRRIKKRLSLNSPTRNQHNFANRTLHETSLKRSNETFSDVDEKLFPIFCGKQNITENNCKVSKPSVAKKLKPLPKNQLLLDLGQKKFGATQCFTCKFVYHMGDPNDELIHLNYHNAGNILRFGGWKEERVVAQLANVKIIKVIPSDPKPWLKKLKDLLEIINRDLGYYEMPVSFVNAQIFLYIKKNVIVGCLVAEPKSTAYKLLCDDIGIDLCSEICYPIKCGVSRIWVSQGNKKEGIGTALLNCLRGNFIYGYILTKEDIVFSSPIEAGKAFAAKYFNNSNFLIYT